MRSPQNDDVPICQGDNRGDGAGAPLNPVASDQELLAEFAALQSDSTFGEIFRRHSGFVYSSALRQVRSEALAEEITQVVFIVLARKAASLTREVALAGWLFRAVRYAILDAHKIEDRRRKREQEAALMKSIDSSDECEAAWEQLAPLIDDALAGLGAKDRNAVLLRFFEKKSFQEIGAVLGTKDNAARSRVLRAVEKLRQFFRKRGVVLSSGLVTGALLNDQLVAAPAGLSVHLMEGGMTNPTSDTIMASVQTLLRRLFWRKAARVTAWFTVSCALVLLMLFSAIDLRSSALRTAANQGEELVKAIDRAFSFGNSQAFLERVHFRAEENQFRSVLSNYVRAAAIFRSAAGNVLTNQNNSVQAFILTVEPLMAGQPTNNRLAIGSEYATIPWMPGTSLALIKIEGRWKWDWFGPLSPAIRDRNLDLLRTKTQMLEELAPRIRSGELINPDRLIEALVSVIH